MSINNADSTQKSYDLIFQKSTVAGITDILTISRNCISGFNHYLLVLTNPNNCQKCLPGRTRRYDNKGMAILILHEDGKTGNDAQASKYLPELARFEGIVITRRLLNHASGIPDHTEGSV